MDPRQPRRSEPSRRSGQTVRQGYYGWNRTIQTVTLTGQQISDLLASGYDAYGNGKGYPYVLVSPVQPEAGKTYQVAICGVSDQLAAEATVTDSGVVGMDAAKAFFGAYTTISRADTAWS